MPNVYQVNILHNAVFMHKIPTKTAPSVFHPRFQRPSYSYTPHFSESNYSLPAHNLKKIRVLIRGLWNNFLARTEKSLETMSLFKSKVKYKVLALEKEAKYFQ